MRKREERSLDGGSSEPDSDLGCKSVRVSKIFDPVRDRELDYDLVCAIAESAKNIGFLHPIAVRLVKFKRGSKVRTKTVLVAGAYRLEAAHYLHHERIECKYVDGNESFVQLVQISEDLFRKHLTVLRRSELLAKWYELVSKDDFSGQVGQKSKRGRPPGGVSKAARALPIGRSVQARRKQIQRAQKIARLQPQAKKAAISAGLADNQQVLLEIAKAHGGKAQLKKVALLAPPSKDQQDKSVELGADSNAKANESGRRGKHSKRPEHPETTFEQLEKLWQNELREPWMYAPFGVRVQFFGMLRRARCKAHTDVVQFVRDAFQGRGIVYTRDLYALAKGRGLSKKEVVRALKALCYHRKRSGYGARGRWYYLNKNLDWKEELPAIFDSELTKLTEVEDYFARGPASSRETIPAETAPTVHVKNSEEAHPSLSDETDDYFGKI